MSDLPLLSGDLLPGASVAGYVIEGVVGRGGMGTVYRAHDPRLDRVVALKVVAAAVAQDAEFRERFVREARSAAAIEHPHIVPVHEVGEHLGLPFLAMRYLDGPDLREVLAVSGPLEPERVGSIALQLASALDVAHAKGLVHRDIKPANVLLPLDDVHDAGHVYLTDFGVARASAATTMTDGGDLVGTLAYVAPEVIAGHPASAASDQYALGCTLFHLLCGRPPFVSDHDAGLLWAHMEQPPPAASSLVEDLPPEADEAFALALAKRPEDRAPSCTLFAERLAMALEGADGAAVAMLEGPDGTTQVVRGGAGSLATIVQRPPVPAPGRPEPDPLPPQARRRALAVAGAVAVGLAAGLGAGLAAGGSEEEPTAGATLRASSGVATVRLGGWRSADAGAGELRGLDLRARWSAETSVRGERVVATVGRLPVVDGMGIREPLPRRASRELLGGGIVRAIELGGVPAVEVEGPLTSQDGVAAAVAVRGTDKGLIGVSCRGRTQGNVAAACRELAGALRPGAGARATSLAPDPEAANVLAAALRRAAGTRADRRALAGPEGVSRAAAARRLGDRRARASRAVRRLSLPPPARGAVRRLAGALDASAGALRRASRGEDDARERLARAERALQRARELLRANGYG
ncbi:MAG TPA: serine/threonine-protein kinase [Baekduia sp.]|nr:serine/threonine-protein kinase [Baekduia sp.]